jgi:hypothetical protein
VLWADEFVVMSALWLAWAALGMRRAARHTLPADVPLAALPLPRLTVVLWQMLPWIGYGTVCCAVAFAGPLLARNTAMRAPWTAGAAAFLLAMGAAQRARMPVGATMFVCGAIGLPAVALSLWAASAVTVPAAIAAALVLAGYVMAAAGAANASRLFRLEKAPAAVGTFAASLAVFVPAALVMPAAMVSLGMPVAFAASTGLLAMLSTTSVWRAGQAAPTMTGRSTGAAGVSSPLTRRSASDAYADL